MQNYYLLPGLVLSLTLQAKAYHASNTFSDTTKFPTTLNRMSGIRRKDGLRDAPSDFSSLLPETNKYELKKIEKVDFKHSKFLHIENIDSTAASEIRSVKDTSTSITDKEQERNSFYIQESQVTALEMEKPKNLNSDEKNKSTDKLYFKFTFSAGQVHFQNVDFSLKTKFNYHYIGAPNVYTFADSTHISSNRGSVIKGNLGFQFGSYKGLFFGANIGGFGNSNVGSFMANLELGYNIPLHIKKLTLQPSVEFSVANIHDYFSQKIPTYGNNVDIFGDVFKYQVCSHAPSDFVRIGMHNRMEAMQLKISLNYAFNPYVSIRLGGGYWKQMNSVTKLYLESDNHEEDINGGIYNSLKENDEVPAKGIYNLNGLYWEVTVLLIPKLNHNARHGSGHSHSHFHSFGGGGFGHC